MVIMKKTIIYFASSNKHKLKEIKSILSPKLLRKIELKNAPKGFTVNENGKTFLANAYKKSKTLSKKLNVFAFADDSGIEVEALGGKPGIKSARFFRDGKGMCEILEKLKNKKNRKCCFTCAIVLTNPKGKIMFETVKSWYGAVAYEIKGENGFGYDPIFLVPKLEKSSAQISSRLKNQISHRGMAVMALSKFLNTII